MRTLRYASSLMALFCALLTVVTVNAQPLPGSNRKPIPRPTPPVIDIVVDNNEQSTMADTVWCTSTKKQHGWHMPLRIISKTDAQHVSLSCRFTNPDKSGHYHKMECIDAYGRYNPCTTFSPYILELGGADTDNSANKEWVDRLEKVCILETVADAQGEVIQERAYDENNNVIFTYSRTPIGKDSLGHEQYVGTYRDYFGLPAEMRSDSLYTYGTTVLITEDRWGNDSIIRYRDAKGQYKLNADDVAMEVFERDENGLTLKQYSCDNEGNKKRDNWGNCGIEYGWTKDHQIDYVIYMDEKWSPIPMPLNDRTISDEAAGIIRRNYKYDRYGREVEEWYTNAEGTIPIAKHGGVHKVVREFDDYGNLTKSMNYDTLCKLTTDTINGVAVLEMLYDGHGRCTNLRFYDKDGLPCSMLGNVCRWIIGYDDDGNEILREEYIIINGKEKLSYKHTNNDSIETTIWKDGSYDIVKRDKQGREILNISYVTEKPEYGWKKITDYQDMGGGYCMAITRYYDGYGNPDRDGIFKIVEEFDSLKLCSLYKTYDSDENLTFICRRFYDRDFNRILGQQAVNAFGVACRSGGDSGVNYYNAYVHYTPKGESGTLVGRDEFGEPDYISLEKGWCYYYSRNGSWRDENNLLSYLGDVNDFPKVMSIEVTDSMAYSLGIKDNDVILAWGNYRANLEYNIPLVTFRTEWALYSVVEANDIRDMVVFRVDPDTKNYNLVPINKLKGTPSQLGFNVHQRFLTKRQQLRIEDAIEKDQASISPLLQKQEQNQSNFTDDGKDTVVVCYIDLFRDNMLQPFPRQCTDASILLSWSTPDWGKEWANGKAYDDAIFTMVSNRGLAAESYPRTTMQYTRDMSTIEELTYDTRWAYCNFIRVSINEKVYKKLLKLTKKAKKAKQATTITSH